MEWQLFPVHSCLGSKDGTSLPVGVQAVCFKNTSGSVVSKDQSQES